MRFLTQRARIPRSVSGSYLVKPAKSNSMRFNHLTLIAPPPHHTNLIIPQYMKIYNTWRCALSLETSLSWIRTWGGLSSLFFVSVHQPKNRSTSSWSLSYDLYFSSLLKKKCVNENHSSHDRHSTVRGTNIGVRASPTFCLCRTGQFTAMRAAKWPLLWTQFLPNYEL